MLRMIDIAGATLGLILISPLFLVVALAIKVQDGGAVMYRARRVGRGGTMFDLLKFRTMVTGADRVGGGITINNDPRVTPLGRLLRRHKVDELPQLWNVLIGEMSFVGPRPEDPRFVELYQPVQRGVLSFRPGITSPASLQFRHEEEHLSGPNWRETYVQRILPEKLNLELAYFPDRSISRDLLLIAKTIRELFR